MMKHIKTLLVATLLLAFVQPLQAQTFLKKELKIENNEEDGFEFRWYLYSYLQGQDTLYAAYTLNGERITPLSDYIDKKHHRGYKPWYCGGGMFMFDLKKTNAFGERICVGYNLRGQIVFPKELEAKVILYWGDGKFLLMHKTDYGREIESAYDVNGNCLIPAGLEYNRTSYIPEYKCFWCSYLDASGKRTAAFTYTADGKYFAEGKFYASGSYDPTLWYILTDPEELRMFNKHKKPNPYITNGASPAVASSSRSLSSTSSSSQSNNSSTTSSSSKYGKLLYKGTYTSNGMVYTGNQSMNVMSGTYEIEIYEKAMTLNGLYCELKEVMSNGTRRYDWSNMNSYLVSPSYDIRKIYPSQFFGVPDGVEYFQKGQVATPAPTQQMGQYPQQTYSQQPSQPQPSPGYTPQPAQQKDCTICHGSGKCNTCNGKGYYTSLGLGSGTHPCPNCPNHSGRCQWCNGTGKQN